MGADGFVLKRPAPPAEALEALDADAWVGLIAAAVDLTLLIDPRGTVRDFGVSGDHHQLLQASEWVGTAWPATAWTAASAETLRGLLEGKGAAARHAGAVEQRLGQAVVTLEYRLLALAGGWRLAAGRLLPEPATTPEAWAGEADRSRMIEQLTELVGRVPLRDLVRQSTDLVERLCIETALRKTRDNRASAAELLGLSRQSLYSKLRRHGLMGHDGQGSG